MEEISIKLKRIRKENNLTQSAFAVSLGVTASYISAIEKGKAVPSCSLLKLICYEYHMNERELTGDEGAILESVALQEEKINGYQAIYRCRLCGELYNGSYTKSQIMALGNMICVCTETIDKEPQSPYLHDIHNCSDGSIGVGDFQGYKKVDD